MAHEPVVNSSKGESSRGMDHSARCRCKHEDCAPLKEDRWCCHWFFICWVARREVLPSEILSVLEDALGTEFRFEMSMGHKGVFRMLAYLEDSSLVDGELLHLLPAKDDPSFVYDECRAWSMACCEYSLALDWACWRDRLSYDGSDDSNDSEDGDSQDGSVSEDDSEEADGVWLSGGKTGRPSLVETLDGLVENAKKRWESNNSKEDERVFSFSGRNFR